MTELDKMQAEVNFFYLDEHHDDDQLDNHQLKHQCDKEHNFDHTVF